MKNNLSTVQHFLNSNTSKQRNMFENDITKPLEVNSFPVINLNRRPVKAPKYKDTWEAPERTRPRTNTKFGLRRNMKSRSKWTKNLNHDASPNVEAKPSTKLFVNQKLNKYQSSNQNSEIRKIQGECKDLIMQKSLSKEGLTSMKNQPPAKYKLIEDYQKKKQNSKRQKPKREKSKKNKKNRKNWQKESMRESLLEKPNQVPFRDFLKNRGYVFVEDLPKKNYKVADTDYWTDTEFPWDEELKHKNLEVFGHTGFRLHQVRLTLREPSSTHRRAE